MRLQMPNFYVPPLGLPLNWRNETTGALPAAVWAYITHGADRRQPAPTADQLELLIDYIRHYINAPCWDFPDNYYRDDLVVLRERAKGLKTVDDVQHWIYWALEIALDPF